MWRIISFSVFCVQGCYLLIRHCFIRTFVAPLERLKLEYIVRGEQRHLFELVRSIAATQGLRGFWNGNLINILRTAPFKAVNFYAYDTYRKQLLRFSGNDETTHYERFIAGAAAGMTASVLCLPLDTVSATLTLPWCAYVNHFVYNHIIFKHLLAILLENGWSHIKFEIGPFNQ